MKMPKIGESGEVFILEKGMVGGFDRLNRLVFLHFDGDVVGFEFLIKKPSLLHYIPLSDISTRELKDKFDGEYILRKYLNRIEFIKSIMNVPDEERIELFNRISSEKGYRIPENIF
ncbi:MAG: hypothetical protein DRP25_04255 [Thermotoga sp.]|nr:MAG: hypothetical protein DRP25_04255 [Thermotoga sp.]